MLAKQLPKIRDDQQRELLTLLRDVCDASPFRADTLDTWVRDRYDDLSVLQAYTGSLIESGVEFALEPRDLANQLRTRGDTPIVVVHLQSAFPSNFLPILDEYTGKSSIHSTIDARDTSPWMTNDAESNVQRIVQYAKANNCTSGKEVRVRILLAETTETVESFSTTIFSPMAYSEPFTIPDAPRDVAAHNIQTDSFQLSWTPIHDTAAVKSKTLKIWKTSGQSVKAYKIHLTSSKTNETIVVDAESTSSSTLRWLDGDTDYCVLIFAVTNTGLSPSSDAINVRTLKRPVPG